VRRVVHRGLARAWNSWTHYAHATQRTHALMDHALRILRQPHLRRGLHTWHAWWEDRHGSLRAMHVALYHIVMTREMAAFGAWAYAARRRHAQGLRESMTQGAELKALKAEVMAEVDRLRYQQKRRAALNVCAVLGQWLGATRCCS